MDGAVNSGADEQTIRAAAAELGNAIGDKAVLEASSMAEIKNILTEEQFEKWEHIKSRFHGHDSKSWEHKGEHKAMKEGFGGHKDHEGCREHKDHEGFRKHKGHEGSKDLEAIFKWKDSDGNGELSVEEFTKHGRKTEEDFEKVDTDGDGSLSSEEFETFVKEFKGRHGEGE